jgi:hypothetical protein
VDKQATLIFDDGARKVKICSDAGDRVEVGYDEVEKAVFENTSHMRGGGVAQVIEGAGFYGLIVGAAIAGTHVTDRWLYLRYRDHAEDQSVLIDLPKESSAQVASKASGTFGARVMIADYPEKGAEIKPEELKAIKSKQKVKVDKKNHPLPEVKPEKATLVVVCPALAARFAGKGADFRLHADDQVVAVNRMGTYSFAYLNPGKYRLVSQAQNANGFEIELEAGHEYYLLQNVFNSGVSEAATVLTRDSPELVSYFLEGSYFSDWKPKEKKKK